MFGWAPFGCLVVGLLYLATSPRRVAPLARLLPATYAPASAIIYVALAFTQPTIRAVAIPPAAYIWLQAVPIVLLAVSLRYFRGPRWVHAILVPVALICMAWQFVWGYWGIYGK